MSCRILHCGTSLVNYYICIKHKVAGFTKRVANVGDIVYFAVKVKGKTYCGARGYLTEVTDERPWENAEMYPQSYKVNHIEYCEPFELGILSSVGGKHWNLKYLQSSKTIADQEAVQLLNDQFMLHKTDSLFIFEDYSDENEVIEESTPRETAEAPEEINIMGTFLTIKFENETSNERGLEKLVNKNFYNLFEEFPERRTILIPESRKFMTAKLINQGNEVINGISAIPDGLLLNFEKDKKSPIQINLIEYECYGEDKIRSSQKFDYLNNHIIPQLIRFASTFSIVTDTKLREETIKKWTDKILDYIYKHKEVEDKITRWVKELKPDVNERGIFLEVNNLLVQAFRENLRIILVIDEMTTEQKNTIKNIINSFRLETGKIDFLGYVVRLEQRINLLNPSAEYALSIQK